MLGYLFFIVAFLGMLMTSGISYYIGYQSAQGDSMQQSMNAGLSGVSVGYRFAQQEVSPCKD